MRGDQRVNCMLGVFYWGGGVLVLHCKQTALDGCAVQSIQSSVSELTGRTRLLFT
ncbi:unnamed protein product, partial [Staurois parvus]